MIDSILAHFIAWTKVKLHLHTQAKRIVYFREREVWWASIGVNIGHEQNGKNDLFERPVVVLRKFNEHVLWIVPMTSQNKQGKYHVETKYRSVTYSIILSQLRIISSKRLTRKIRTLPKEEFEQLRKHVRDLLL